MNLCNGVKIYRIGEGDWVYAPNEAEALEVMNDMIGKEDVAEMLIDDPIEELTQEQFDKGEIYWDDDGDIDKAVANNHRIPYKEALEKCLADGSTSGHFMTTEW